ncbi:HEAT repeat domain-containing protein [Chitinophaga flava]|uniref:HEAT repeat domain-containing protein n=1 Tax=Chitinophaga flava TaxID=2259036 RepID=A0A365XUV0_9BACT|nr:HEAT repeat domain-containing protein [Chitinophaga flava]RBL90146.1 hypothetical protein DF182_27145 [Chitinophaga flava]
MDLWQYISILRQPDKTGIFRKDNTNEKLEALEKIRAEGYPGLIYCLIPLLKSTSHPNIREAICDTIVHLFRKMKTRGRLYETVNQCEISTSDIDFYEAAFQKNQLIVLLAISSLNGDGYLREKAVKRLAALQTPEAIPFLIYRLADWVPQVRQSAIEALTPLTRPDFIDAFVTHLPLLQWLRQVQRTDPGPVAEEIRDFIIHRNRAIVLQHFSRYPDKARLILAQQLSASYAGDSRELSIFIRDQLYLIRLQALEHFGDLSTTAIEKLLTDKSPKVRIHTLYKLQGAANFHNIIQRFIADDAASIRSFARFVLKENEIDYKTIYYNNLQENRQISGSMAGLAETGAKEHAAAVERFLHHPFPHICCTAFLALTKLDEPKARSFAINHMANEIPGIRNVTIGYLSRVADKAVLETARLHFKTGSIEIKKSMLKLFSQSGGWPTLADLILGTIDTHETIRLLSTTYLATWKNRAITLYTKPSPEDMERARIILGLAHEQHEKETYFSTNPLTGLDFYLR